MKVTGDLFHLQHETGSQVLDILQIILHWVGQVHQVVQVNGIIFSSFELQVKRLGLTYIKGLHLSLNETEVAPAWMHFQWQYKMCSHQIEGWVWVSGAGSEWFPLALVYWFRPQKPFCDWSHACLWGSTSCRLDSEFANHYSPCLLKTLPHHNGLTRLHPVWGSPKSSSTERIKGAVCQFNKLKSVHM